jgi:putative redox protein
VSGPTTEIRLHWEGGERFSGQAGAVDVVIDGSSPAVLSPMQAVALGLAGCMSVDVATILEKGRQPLAGMEVRLVGQRAEQPPRRFLAFRLHYRIEGAVDPARVERAVELSRERYCSAWHSLRTDISLETSYEIVDGPGGRAAPES